MTEWGELQRTCREKAIEILREKQPQGVRFKELVEVVARALPPEFSPSQVRHAIWDLDRLYPEYIQKPARGIFRYGSGPSPGESSETSSSSNGVTESVDLAARFPEKEFYAAFANYLKGEGDLGLEECTQAISIGEKRTGGKWSNPDVIGVYRSPLTDIIKEEPLIVAAEIKVDTSEGPLITGFGQACSYRLLSHKVYLVIPKDVEAELRARVESLCQIFGIGLVLFDRTNKDDPDWEIRLRAVRSEPDLYYLNQYLRDAREISEKLLS